MVYIKPEIIEELKKIDLLTYLRDQEPHELVHLSGNNYTTKTHDSLKISNGMWYWFSRNIGGRSALDYLIKVQGISFLEAAEILVNGDIRLSSEVMKSEQKEKKVLLPAPYENVAKVKEYLKSRGIDSEIISWCVEQEYIYESAQYHNVVFVGMDQNKIPRYAALRGIYPKGFKGEANGSDKQYSFRIPTEETSHILHVFEAAIDLLSFGTLRTIENRNWKLEHLLSLAGVFLSSKKDEKKRVPLALTQFLKDYPEVTTIVLHLDLDRPGREASAAIIEALKDNCIVKDEPPRRGKDMNDMLCLFLGLKLEERG